jgi:hypothetical protein
MVAIQTPGIHNATISDLIQVAHSVSIPPDPSSVFHVEHNLIKDVSHILGGGDKKVPFQWASVI